MTKENKMKMHTVLNELEAIGDVSLIGGKDKTPPVDCLVCVLLLRGEFRAKLNASANDPASLSAVRGLSVLEIRTGVRLADVGREWASGLAVGLSLETEVVVLLRVRGEGRIVLERRDIDGGTWGESTRQYSMDALAMLTNLPLFHLPMNRAPRSSLPSARVKPGRSIGLSCRNLLNSGTSWKRYLKARKLPSNAHDGRCAATSSPSRPRSMMPWRIVSWPGFGSVSIPLTAGCEIPSKKPKL